MPDSSCWKLVTTSSGGGKGTSVAKLFVTLFLYEDTLNALALRTGNKWEGGQSVSITVCLSLNLNATFLRKH